MSPIPKTATLKFQRKDYNLSAVHQIEKRGPRMKRIFAFTMLPLILAVMLGLLPINRATADTSTQRTPDSVHHRDLSVPPSKGPSDAPVVLAVFSDFQCPACARLAPVLEQVHEKYPDEVKLMFMNFPLSKHPYAKGAAIAAFAARRQGKFWEYHDRLFENFDNLSDHKFQEIARELGLDPETFEKDRNDLKTVARVNQDIRYGARLGVTGTPTIFVNGNVSRARTLEELQAEVEQELQRVRM